jgi:threonine synthase
MVCVQSDRCDGITTAFHLEDPVSEYTDNGFTIANGLRVPKPFADRLILRVLRESRGTAIRISDAEMQLAMAEIARKEGLLIAPEGAALWPAFKSLLSSGRIHSGETVLLLNTGSGYKYLENIREPVI